MHNEPTDNSPSPSAGSPLARAGVMLSAALLLFSAVAQVTFAGPETVWAPLIARLEADIARRVPTNGDDILYDCNGTMITDRKAAGEHILAYAHQMRTGGTEACWTLGAFSGFDLEISGYDAMDDEEQPGLSIYITVRHHGEQRRFEITEKTRPGTIVGRIVSSICNLDADLAAVRANLEANERRLPAFEARLGKEFPDTALLEEKLQERAELEAELANTKGEFEPGNDDEAPLTDDGSDEGDLLAGERPASFLVSGACGLTGEEGEGLRRAC